MKYFDELNELENSMIQLESCINILGLISHAAESCDRMELEDGLCKLKNVMKSEMTIFYDKYQQLFEQIREDTRDEN